MQTASSPQSHMNVHLLPVPQYHHRLCRDLAGHSNDPGLPLHCVCRSRSPPAGVFLPLTGYFLAQEWLTSETEILPKVVFHEWWAYELTDDGNSRSTLFLPIQRCGQRFFFPLPKEILLLSHIVQKFSESGTVGCVSGTW